MSLEESKQETEVSPTPELVKVKASLKEKGVLVSEKESIESLSTRGYGVPENGNLSLAFFEALFLISKEILEVFDEKTGNSVSFQDVLERFKLADKDMWVKYLVYRDLRSRGYVVREGFGLGIDFRVYERGEYGKEIATYLIFVIQEGQPVLIEELARALNYVLNLKKKLVLAVINRRGEVVYYSVSQFTLSENL
jgi:tRNA-intron endonuclease